MTDSTLYPPNGRWLSDNVIGSVVQRNRSLGKRERAYYADLGAGYDDSLVDATSSFEPSARRFQIHDSSRAQGYREDLRDDSPPSPKRQARAASTSRGGRSSASSSRDDSHNSNEFNALERHRERRRLTQIRYRTKLRNRGETLDEEVQVLRDEVSKLETQRKKIAPRLLPSKTPLSVAAEYFRLFRYALTAYVPFAERCNVSDSENVYESHAHREFLLATMIQDVDVDGERGVEAILERWRFISQVQPNFEIQSVGLESGLDGSVVATTKTKMVMCRSTLEAMFPNLFRSGRGEYIATKLQGQRFEISGSIYFEWDKEIDRVSSLHHKADVITPMLRFLGNVEDLALVFDPASAHLKGRLLLSPSV